MTPSQRQFRNKRYEASVSAHQNELVRHGAIIASSLLLIFVVLSFIRTVQESLWKNARERGKIL
jgi:hypothetical protein